MNDCIFCKIAEGSIPARKVYEDDFVVAFHDLAPQAPVHVVIIPKEHAANLNKAARSLSDETLARLLRTAADVASILGIADSGYRIISNCGPDARQSVQHLHVHLLGGEQLPEKIV